MNIAELAPYFSDESAAISFIESQMWPDGPVCPRCGGTDKIYRIAPNPEKRVRYGLHKCDPCKHQVTVKFGTIFDYHIASGSSAIDFGDGNYLTQANGAGDVCDLDNDPLTNDLPLDLDGKESRPNNLNDYQCGKMA